MDIRARLVILNNQQSERLTTANIADIKNAFNDKIKEQEMAFFDKYTKKGWDLYGLEESINNKRGKDWAAVREDKKNMADDISKSQY